MTEHTHNILLISILLISVHSFSFCHTPWSYCFSLSLTHLTCESFGQGLGLNSMFPVLIAGECWEDKLKICFSNLKSFTGLWVHKWVKTETHHLLQKTQSPAVLPCPLLLIPTTHPQEHTWPLFSHQLYFKKVSKELKALCDRPDNSPSKMLAFYSLVPVNMSLSMAKGTLQIQLRLRTWDGEIILHYAGRPSVITWSQKWKRKAEKLSVLQMEKEVMSQGMWVASSS